METYEMQLIESLAKALAAIEKVYPEIKKIDTIESVMAAFMTILDIWAADHDVTDEEVTQALEAAIEVRPEVLDEVGRSPKSSETEGIENEDAEHE